jgi:hypothetical protein
LSIDSLKKIQNQKKPIMGSKEISKTRRNANDCSTRLDLAVSTCWFSDWFYCPKAIIVHLSSKLKDFKANDI